MIFITLVVFEHSYKEKIRRRGIVQSMQGNDTKTTKDYGSYVTMGLKTILADLRLQ